MVDWWRRQRGGKGANTDLAESSACTRAQRGLLRLKQMYVQSIVRPVISNG